VPARQTTACTFDDGATLFITTSRDGLGDAAEPGAGAVFAVDAGVRGGRPYAFAG
jgi:sugar lactone lactonase YvrE